MCHYGIIGKPLTHSFSAPYFAQKFAKEGIEAEYKAYEMDELSTIATLMDRLHGFNVTYPLKERIIPYLRGIDTVADTIGAVNVVCDGKGYNTDWIGFKCSIQPHLLPHDKKVLVLGTGGASKAVQYALKALQLDFTLVSRHPHATIIGYDDLTKELMTTHTVIINCTPLGMYPSVESLPAIPYEHLTSRHMLYDCVYNPAQTAFLLEGAKRGARTMNGLEMLHIQADEAWKIWNR